MYLKGSKWSPAKKKRRGNPLRLLILIALVAGAIYVNWGIVPYVPPLFVPTMTPTRSPESYLKDANDLVAKGKVNQAILAYQQAVEADPRNPSIYITLAQLQVWYGDYKSAMDNVETALLINQNHALAHAVRGWILGKQQKYLEGEAEVTTSLNLDPNSGIAYAYLSEIYKDMIDAGKSDYNTIDKARAASKKAVDLDPGNLEVHRARGLVLEVTGNNEEAIAEFQAAININENLDDLYIDLARNYRVYPKDEPNYGEAIKALNHAISLRPDLAEPYSELARTYLTVGDYANGIQMAALAVERQPADPLMHGLLGTLYYKSGDNKTAVDEFSLAIRGGLTSKGVQVTPIAADGSYTFVVYYARYGNALANLNRCSEALQVAQQLLQTAPSDDTARLNAQSMQDTCNSSLKTPQTGGTATPAATVTPAPAK